MKSHKMDVTLQTAAGYSQTLIKHAQPACTQADIQITVMN